MEDEPNLRMLVMKKAAGKFIHCVGVAEAYTTQPNRKAGSRVLYVYLACMAG
jgi:hypothetical protein